MNTSLFWLIGIVGAGGYLLAMAAFIFIWAKLFEPERRLRDQREAVNTQFVRLHPDLDKAEQSALSRGNTQGVGAARAAKIARTHKALEVVK